MRFVCPHCAMPLTCDEGWAGQLVQCPACNNRVKVPGEAGASSAGGAAAGGGRRRRRSAYQWGDRSSIPAWAGALIALGFTVVWYLAVYPFEDTYFGELFYARGPVPYALVFLTGWAWTIIAVKFYALRRQQAALIFDALPMGIAEDITRTTVEAFLNHVDRLPLRLQDCLLVMRVRRGLEHFLVRQNNQEVADLMSSQSDIDANAIQSSYTMVKVFIWAIPILGFIGTVMGISEAIGAFSGSLDKAEDVQFLVDSINRVTGGLGVAFDTTLVALVLSLLVSFPSSGMQKAEEEFLNRVDEYCNENLLKRLDDGSGGLGEIKTEGDVVRAMATVVGQMGELHREQVEQVRQTGEALREQLAAMGERAQEHGAAVDAHLGQALELMRQGIGERAAESIRQTEGTMAGHLGALAEGVRRLNDALRDLGERRIVVRQLRRPKGLRFFVGAKGRGDDGKKKDQK